MTRIAAIIVDYKKHNQVPEAVKSILRQNGDFQKQIVIVDNDPGQEEKKYNIDPEDKKDVRFVFPEKNIGYSKGNNIGAKGIDADFLLILNADIKLPDPNSLEKICGYLASDQNTAILGTKQICPDGKTENTVRKFPSLLAQIIRRTELKRIRPFQNIVNKYECEEFDYEKTQEVDWLQSSFWVVQKDFWDEVKGFDEDYFVFMADTEMCLQAWKRGKKVVYFSDVSVEADGIRASEGGFFDFFRKRVLRIHAKDALKYFWKHLFEKNPRES